MEGKPVDTGLTWKLQDQIEIQAVGVLILSQVKFDAQKAFSVPQHIKLKRVLEKSHPWFSQLLFWVHLTERTFSILLLAFDDEDVING